MKKTVIPFWKIRNAINDKLGKDWEKSTHETLCKTRDEICDNLINVEILYKLAADSGVVLSRGAGEMRSRLIEQSYKNKEDFNEALKNAGMTEKEYMDLWFQQAVINMFVTEKIENKIEVTESDIEIFYEENKNEFKTKTGYKDIKSVEDRIKGFVLKKKTADRIK